MTHKREAGESSAGWEEKGAGKAENNKHSKLYFEWVGTRGAKKKENLRRK